MKISTSTFLAAFAFGLGAVMIQAEKAATKATDADGGRIQVVFQDPDKFTDVKDGMMESEKGRDAVLDDIKRFIVDRAPDFLGAGKKLVITFTEIDLAGEYEPWRTPPASDIRIVKSIYPPKLDFTYKLIDGTTGATLKEGKEELRDLAFQTRLTIHRDDPLRYEKDMLLSWMREALREPKGKK